MAEDQNRIEELKQSLYSRNAPEVRSRRRFRSKTEESEVPQDWGNKDGSEGGGAGNGAEEAPRHHMSFFTKFFLASVVFCLIAIGIGAYIFFNGGNFISGNNIEINISGPVTVSGGSPVSFAITVSNKNTVALKTADMVVHFPAGTTDPSDTTKAMDIYSESLGEIPSGGSVTKNIDAVIFGEQNLVKKITVKVTYGIAGSSSVFTKEASYEVTMTESPLSISVTSLDESISGQPFDMNVSIKSNSTNTIQNVIMRAAYPFGYAFKSSTPLSVTSDGAVWSIGDLPPGGERKINIQGVLTGEDSDIRVFHFTIGTKSSSNPNAIGTVFLETERVLTIKKPFVSIDIDIDNDASKADHVGLPGAVLNIKLNWSNNLPETLSNVEIAAHLAGSAYDKNNVSTWSGYFRSATNDIVWDQRTNPELAAVSSGSDGTLQFSITPAASQSSDSHILNPELTISGMASGDRTSSSNVPLNTGTVSRRIKIATIASLSGRIARGTSAIANTGPVPPVAEQKTTYTVIWSVDNTSSTISDGSVTATLPAYVSWTGVISPNTENVTYDKNSGTVTWNVGSVPAFASVTSGRKEVQFQIAIEPSVDQIGSSPIIVNKATFSGTDTWTKSKVESTQGYLTTSFSTDPTYRPGDERVAR